MNTENRQPASHSLAILAVLSVLSLGPSPVFAQCKALYSVVPVPGSFDDAGATCVEANLLDVGDGTVADTANHLLWSKAATCTSPAPSTSDFGYYCYNLVLGGRDDWYLPDVAQLQTLLPPGTCHAVMDDCGDGDPDYPSENGILWSSSLVSPSSYYCPVGYGCHLHKWAVATGLGTNFGVLPSVPLLPPRKRVDALDVTDGCLVRCIADGLVLGIAPDPATIPANELLQSGKVLTEARLSLELTDVVGPASGVDLTLRSDRPTVDTIDGPATPTGTDGRTEAFVSTHDQTSPSTIDSTTPLVATNPKGVITWLPAKYQTPFTVTCYITALESDYSSKRILDASRYTWCTSPPPTGYAVSGRLHEGRKSAGIGSGRWG